MFTEGIFPIGDGLLDINEERLKELLVPDDINEIYDLEQTPFARGKFAAVRRAVHKNSGVHFAAKFLKRRRRAQSSDKEIKHEIAVLKLCDGAENIVKLNAVHESRSETALLLELATGGELQTFLDNEECLSEAHARYCMREVLKALQFLHKRSIAHLDLKPQNILLTGERIEDGLKLCDFGISRVVAEGTNVREIVGTPDYVAPEVLQYEPLSLLTDIWSVGVLAYVLLSGFSPFGGETKQETFLNISQCALTFPDKLFGGVSGAAIDFIRRALRIKPNDRMTAAGCLEHIWLSNECSIDRQIRTDIAKATAVDDVDDEDEDEDGEEDVEQLGEDEDYDDDKEEVVEDDNELQTDNGMIENENAMLHDDADYNDDEHNNSVCVEIAEQINGTINGSKMESSDVEDVDLNAQIAKPMIMTNGKTVHNNNSNSKSNGGNSGSNNRKSQNNSNGYKNYNGRNMGNNTSIRSNGSNTNATGVCGGSGSGAGIKYTNGTKLSSNANGKSAATKTTTQRTTAIVTVPAMRATTIPLQYKSCHHHHYQQQKQQQHQHQQHLQIPARRHSSSDSNKENTYLATKKIMPTTITTATAMIKKPLTATATTTILIGDNGELGGGSAAVNTTTTTNVATFTLPYNVYSHVHNISNSTHDLGSVSRNKTTTTTTATNCLFPDAPTTPKVIRKTPNAEASPTSVKALVKKFQLEGGNTSPNGTITTTTHLKEAQSTNQQQTQEHANTANNETTTTQMTNIISYGNKKSSPISNGITKKFVGDKINASANNTPNNGGRRASEPTTQSHITITHNRSGSGSGVGGGGGGNGNIANYKSTCVLCLSCGSKSTCSATTNGCRHPMNTTSSATNKLSKMVCNKNNNSTATATSKSTNTTTAHLLGSPQQQQQQHINGVNVHSHAHTHHHHHHHHHHPHHMHAAAVATATAKNVTANNLSLDQGIIC